MNIVNVAGGTGLLPLRCAALCPRRPAPPALRFPPRPLPRIGKEKVNFGKLTIRPLRSSDLHHFALFCTISRIILRIPLGLLPSPRQDLYRPKP